MNNIPTIGITQGDHNGVGLEVTLKALEDETMLELITPVLYADIRLVERAVKDFQLDMPPFNMIGSASEASEGCLNIVDLKLKDTTVTPGTATSASGAGAVQSLRCAMSDVKAGKLDAIVTAPICKEAVQADDFHFSGHTEYLAAEAGDEYRAQMILFDDHLRVALVTTHLPLAEIPSAVTETRIVTALADFARTLREDFSISRPKIAVLSLNPHSGDGGLLGHEEENVITPAIESCYDTGILAFGPFAADGFFGSGNYTHFDGVLAMYHDQGLAPFKTIAGERGVNFTAGLPFVRTSPDHGTAFDIAWSGKADPTSMREAIYKAIDICRHRATYRKNAANPLKKQPERAARTEHRERPERQVKSFEPKTHEKQQPDKHQGEKPQNSNPQNSEA